MPSLPCAVSPASSFDSSIQDSVDSTAKSKRGQGRPRKVPVAPTYDDFRENGTAEEKKRWKLRKNAEEWWYKKLMSEEAEEYHEKKIMSYRIYVRKMTGNYSSGTRAI